jgi:hypothetical protein
MEFKKIYNLLDTGWIYVKFNNEYFNKAFISHIPKKYVKKIDNYIFVKKSKCIMYNVFSILFCLFFILCNFWILDYYSILQGTIKYYFFSIFFISKKY